MIPSGVYAVYNEVKRKMCPRCNHMLRMKCESRHWKERYEQMCICIREVLEANDELYPTELGKRR